MLLVVTASWGALARARRGGPDADRRCASRRARAGIDRAGRKVRPGAQRRDHRALSRPEPPGIGAGAQLVIWPEASTPFYLRPRRRARRADPPAGRRDAHAVSHRHRRVRARRTATARSLLQRRRARRTRRTVARGRTARCSWCRSASTCRSSAAVLRRPAHRGRQRLLRRAPSRRVRRRRPPAQRRDLLRVGVSGDRPRVRRAAAASCSRRSRTTPGSAGRRRPFSISSRARCAPSRKAATSCAPRTPASAARSIRTAACSPTTTLFEPAALDGRRAAARSRTIYSRIGDVVVWLSLAVTGRRASSAWRDRPGGRTCAPIRD